MARPFRPYQASWGECIDGLARGADRRWRVVATGQRFREEDERHAIARFRAMTADPGVKVPFGTYEIPSVESMAQAEVDTMAMAAALDGGPDDFSAETADGQTTYYRRMPPAAMWAWMRDELLKNPANAAKMTGIPALARLKDMDGGSRVAITVDKLTAAYLSDNPATDKAKSETLAAFRRLILTTKAKTLDDLTPDALMAFRRSVEGDGRLQSPATRAAYYGRIKNVIRFGLKVGMDQAQLRASLDRCSVLWTAAPMPSVDPRPISHDHFHSLLTAGSGSWRPWLLLALNCCMYLDEVCNMKWSEFDLAKGTYAAIRGKTRRKRIPRAAILWTETIAAMQQLQRRGESPFIFTSSHGTRYNRNSRGNDFAELRKKAGISDEIKFNHIRDGTFIAACHGTTDSRLPRVLAGHKADGLEDNYVLRNPELTRPACEAVYKAYGPFPAMS